PIGGQIYCNLIIGREGARQRRQKFDTKLWRVPRYFRLFGEMRKVSVGGGKLVKRSGVEQTELREFLPSRRLLNIARAPHDHLSAAEARRSSWLQASSAATRGLKQSLGRWLSTVSPAHLTKAAEVIRSFEGELPD